MPDMERSLGSTYLTNGVCRFRVWAPQAEKVEVRLLQTPERLELLKRDEWGYHVATIQGVEPGARYYYRLNGSIDRPDPASLYQPEGVHGPSQVVDSEFPWTDQGWSGIPLDEYIIYELHVGTFTDEGTFTATIAYLEELKDLGVTAVELMPVAQFPGERNWGYDGVGLCAAQNSYGGPEGLKHLINSCHSLGLAVILDVVYNHLGPEGNYLADFGPYFTHRYSTPWGAAINFDGADSDQVRQFFIENALYWTSECHIDALRLDAVHAILDQSPRTFLEELSEAVEKQVAASGRAVHLIAESSANDVRLITQRESHGLGMDAQWSDDFHHSLHCLLTGESGGYYQDYGKVGHLVKAIQEGFAYSGEYSPYRRRRHGSSSRSIPAKRFVVCSQNHDQIGNRMAGDRLSRLVSTEAQKLAAGALLLSPFVPLLFMGEEYGESAAFPYFISHSDQNLVEAVRRGRKEEFAAFQQVDEPLDPQSEETFLKAKLNRSLLSKEPHKSLRDLYQELIRLRKEVPALSNLNKEHLEVRGWERPPVIYWRRWQDQSQVAAIFNFASQQSAVPVPLPYGHWRRLLDSSDIRWQGPGGSAPEGINSEGSVSMSLAPHSFLLLERYPN